MSVKTTDIAIIDYGMGNTHSVLTAVTEATNNKRQVLLTNKPEDLIAANHVIFPGVGAIADCMKGLQQNNLDIAIIEIIHSKPLLGICVGMQALLTMSEENNGTKCLGLLEGNIKKFTNATHKVPHMGWNQVTQHIEHPLWQGITDNSWFYFVHSYYLNNTQHTQTAATCSYSVEFVAAVHKENIFAVQFHPEKSYHAGIQLYKNFLNWNV